MTFGRVCRPEIAWFPAALAITAMQHLPPRIARTGRSAEQWRGYVRYNQPCKIMKVWHRFELAGSAEVYWPFGTALQCVDYPRPCPLPQADSGSA